MQVNTGEYSGKRSAGLGANAGPVIRQADRGGRVMDHIPVMAAEVLSHLIHKNTELVIDGTVGAGGHAQAILESRSDIRLIGVDRDPTALHIASDRLARFGNRVRLVRGVFPDIGSFLSSNERADGILIDLGLSSMQLDDPGRGFSYSAEGLLDMRMDPEGSPLSDWLAAATEADIARVLRRYGEVTRAGRIARRIREAARLGDLNTTLDLKNAAEKALGAGVKPSELSRIFQAFRVHVNRELELLDGFLAVCIDHLKPGGRIVIISYHSLEDRAVKIFFKTESAICICPPGLPVCACGHKPRLRVLTRRVVKPSAAEIAANSRARSARLRAAEVV
jgi:16S rRNA (cytosine1402-N4)-methyltransferase